MLCAGQLPAEVDGLDGDERALGVQFAEMFSKSADNVHLLFDLLEVLPPTICNAIHLSNDNRGPISLWFTSLGSSL